MADTESKRCTTCGETKPLSHFPKWAHTKDGHSIYCVPCKAAYDRAYREKNKERIRQRRKKYREDHADVIRAKKKRDYCDNSRAILAKRKLTRNPALESARAARWAKANPDRIAELRIKNAPRVNRIRREKYAANPAPLIERARRYRLSNLDKVRAAKKRYGANPEFQAKRREYATKKREENREYYRAHSLAYVARRNGAGGRGVSPEQRIALVAESLGICAYCNSRCAALELDHIEPLSRGGEHDVENSAMVCRSCNTSKQNTPLIVWLAKLAGARAA